MYVQASRSVCVQLSRDTSAEKCPHVRFPAEHTKKVFGKKEVAQCTERQVFCKIRIFADDCVIYNIIASETNNLKLESDLVKINDWCEKSRMSLNKSK